MKSMKSKAEARLLLIHGPSCIPLVFESVAQVKRNGRMSMARKATEISLHETFHVFICSLI